MLLHDAVAARESQTAQFFMEADCGQVRVALQKLHDPIRVRVQQAGPGRALVFGLLSPLALVLFQDTVHALAIDIEQACDRSLRGTGIVPPDDLVARGFVHAAGLISVIMS
jgi:hypothetical protein